MAVPTVWKAVVWQGSDAVLLARIRSVDGTYLQQSALTSVVLTVYDKANSFTIVDGPLTLTISAVVFNTLQTNSILWPVDDIGYNFLYRLAGAAAFPLARIYRVDVIFTLTDGTHFPVQYDLTAASVP